MPNRAEPIESLPDLDRVLNLVHDDRCVSTLQAVELGVLGPLQVRCDGAAVVIPGAKPRAVLTMLGLHGGAVVSAETLLELLWGDAPRAPRRRLSRPTSPRCVGRWATASC